MTERGRAKRAAAYRVVDDRPESLNRAGEVLLVFERKRELAMDPTKLVDTE